MNIQEVITEFREQGRSREDLYLQLLNNGQTVQAIQEAEESVEKEGRLNAQDIAIRTVAVAGAVMVGLGVLSFVAANWSGLGNLERISVICAGMIAAYLGAWYASLKKLPIVYEALMLLANIIYGAGIFLIGQMYNLELEFIHGFSVFAIGVGGIYLITRAKILPWIVGIVSIFAAGSAYDLFAGLVVNTTLRPSLVLLPVLIAILGGIGYLLGKEDTESQQFDIY